MPFWEPCFRRIAVLVVPVFVCCVDPLVAQYKTQTDVRTTDFRVQLHEHIRRMLARFSEEDPAPRYRVTEVTTELARTLAAPVPDGWIPIHADIRGIPGDVAALSAVVRISLSQQDDGIWGYNCVGETALVYVSSPLPLREFLLQNASILAKECEVPGWMVYRFTRRWKKATDLALWRAVIRVPEVLRKEDRRGQIDDEELFENAVLLRALLDVHRPFLPFVQELHSDGTTVFVLTRSRHDLFQESEAMYYVFVEGKLVYELLVRAYAPRDASASSADWRRIGREVRRIVLKNALELRAEPES